MAPVKVFVAAAGNGFMRDIAEWLVEAAHLAGHDASLHSEQAPSADGSINLVVAPHEFFALSGLHGSQMQRAAAASVCVATEQPGTPWFEASLEACSAGLTTLDINPHGVAALRAKGVNAHHLQLGAVPSMVAAHQAVGDRPLDLVFLGGLDQRRSRVLAGLAPRLWRYRSELRLFRFEQPITAATPGVLFGSAKYHLLGSARVLLNVHRHRSDEQAPAYFEWARMVEAMANGCVVVSEPSTGLEPLVDGVHLVQADAADLGDVIESLLAQPERLDAISRAAQQAVTGPLSLATTLGTHLAQLEREVLPRLEAHVATVPGSTPRRFRPKRPARGARTSFQPYLTMHREAKRIALAEAAALRQLDGLSCLLRHGTHQHLDETSTPAYSAARPEVTVVVPLYNQASTVESTLDSIVASVDVPFDVIVVDDHATDRSRQVAEEYLAQHADAPVMLVAKQANEGLSAARRTGLELARGQFVMFVDADNQVYPTCLTRLADALRASPDAAAAYSILEDFGDASELRSALAWDVARLCRGNYIDAQSMWRRDAWLALGGFDRTLDLTLGGWEDWDLWLRLADRGGRAVLVPEILGRYRVQRGSMVALTNLAHDDGIAAMRSRHDVLPWPAA